MNQKPKIQYIGQFYVYGSEARALEQQNQPKKPKTTLPVEKLQKIEKIYVDPVALVAIAVSVIMLVTMLTGLNQLRSDWAEYERVSAYVHGLREENHLKTEAFRETYTLSDIRSKATAMGMIPKADAQRMTVTVTAPEVIPEPTWLENVIWFVKGMFA